MTTKIPRPRGRPRSFDCDQAVATARHLFHARGYDGVSVADLTEALGINPPSFYAAFGSKACLYARVLDHYNDTDGIPLAVLMRSDRPVREGLAAVLEEAARRYAADPTEAGCLVIEGSHAVDGEARRAACSRQTSAEEQIRAFVAARHPDEAARIADFVSVTMAGMSAKARSGHGLDRLLATARLAGIAIAEALPG